mgnify:CR=1 FL=1
MRSLISSRSLMYDISPHTLSLIRQVAIWLLWSPNIVLQRYEEFQWSVFLIGWTQQHRRESPQVVMGESAQEGTGQIEEADGVHRQRRKLQRLQKSASKNEASPCPLLRYPPPPSLPSPNLMRFLGLIPYIPWMNSALFSKDLFAIEETAPTWLAEEGQPKEVWYLNSKWRIILTLLFMTRSWI